MKLDKLQNGRSAKVTRILCNEKTKKRLFKMGLTEGVSLTLVRRAPLGDPIELKVRDFYLAIRLSTAKQIDVDGALCDKNDDKNSDGRADKI